MKNKKFLKEIVKILSWENKIIYIKKANKVIFVGDTHGDWEVSQKIIKNYLRSGDIIVFLGDYIDRGEYSKENLDFLLKTKVQNPNQIYLLQGNHEGYPILKFSPANFWESLNNKDYQLYASILEKLPLVIVVKDIIALHGALPEIKNLREINKITLGSEIWLQITWGDFEEIPGRYLGVDPFSGRPKFGQDWFFEKMKKFKKKVLIRSHQPDCPQFMFDERCLTIFSSSAYTRERTIAIANLEKEIKTAKDLEIIRI
jgi:protein phosphatase